MEMTNNFTNYINGSGELSTFINGVSPIERITDGITSMQRDEYWSKQAKAREEARLVWESSDDYKALIELRLKQHKLWSNTDRSFWTRDYKNKVERDATAEAIKTIYNRNVQLSWSIPSTAYEAASSISSHVQSKAEATVVDTRLPQSTIRAILLTTVGIENKSFDDILKIVNKYVSK
jgi:hypothetical protein